MHDIICLNVYFRGIKLFCDYYHNPSSQLSSSTTEILYLFNTNSSLLLLSPDSQYATVHEFDYSRNLIQVEL